MSLASLIRNRALTAADTWERHLVVAQLAGQPKQVVDVGGLPGQLRSFLPGASVAAANIAPPADLLVELGRCRFAIARSRSSPASTHSSTCPRLIARRSSPSWSGSRGGG